MWKPGDDGKPLHLAQAYELGLLDNDFIPKSGVKFGLAQVDKGNFRLTGGSRDFPEYTPTPEEFQELIDSNIEFL